MKLMTVIRDINGSPAEFGEQIYWYFSEFDLETEDVKKICFKFLKLLMEQGDTAERFYYGEVRNYLRERGKI